MHFFSSEEQVDVKDAGRRRDEEFRWDGRSEEYVTTTGERVAKTEGGRAFAVYTAISVVGIALVMASFAWSPWLVVPGVLLALIGVSNSYVYTSYTHWYGLLVAVVVIGGVLAHLAGILGIDVGLLGR